MGKAWTLEDLEGFIREHRSELARRVRLCGKECPFQESCRRFDGALYGHLVGSEPIGRNNSRFPWLKRLLFSSAAGTGIAAHLHWRREVERYQNAGRSTGRACPHHVAYYLEHEDEIRSVYNLLSDEVSRRVFLSILARRLTFEYHGWEETAYSPDLPQYFIPELPLGDQEFVVDCGAYSGDTFLEYLQRVGEFRKYHLYECDPQNLEALRETVTACGRESRVVLRPVGVFDENATLVFSTGQGVSSGVAREGTGVRIDVVKLDSDLPARDVTFIKMDVEGSELAALHGAEDLLRKCRPKLAICLYHNPEDFLTIPSYVHRICPEYRHFLIRHHSRYPWLETVLYVW